MNLRPYQEQAADFLFERDRAMILAPVGAGKTAITLTAMQDMLQAGHAKRFLVLAPKRVAASVWPVEQPKWAPGVTLAAAHARHYARFVAEGALPTELARFSTGRFDVQAAA